MGVLLIISLVMIMSVSAIAAADTNETLLEDVSDTDIVTTSLGYGGDNVTSYNDGGGVDDVDELKVNDKSDEISTKKEVKVTSSSNEGLLSASNDDVLKAPGPYHFGSDSYALLEEAVDAAVDAGGGTIYIEGGRHDMLEELHITDNTNLVFSRLDPNSEVTLVSDHKHYLFWLTDADATFTFNGINFEGGKADYGGAMEIDAKVTLNDCVFSSNWAVESDIDTLGLGGAIYVNSDGSLIANNCKFLNNWAGRKGGAIYNKDGSVTLNNCIFKGNTKGRDSGEVDNDFDDGLQITQEKNILKSNDDENDILSDGPGNYSGLSSEIGSGGSYIGLQHDYYSYDGSNDTIEITVADSVIDGKGAVIDMAGSTIQAFKVSASGVTIKNLTIKNVNYEGNGGAIYFAQAGTVTDCNFTDNKATGNYSYGGAVYFLNEGTVANCNFESNTATYEGGAVFIWEEGTVTNCNFTDNSAVYGGAIKFYTSGRVTNCNFANNKVKGDYSYGGAVWMNSGSLENSNFESNTAEYEGGAVWMYSGRIENSNFTANNATTGSAVYFGNASADKAVFDSRFLNNRANAERIQITENENNILITFTGNDNMLNAIYCDVDVEFTNVTYWGADGIDNTGDLATIMSGSAKEAGQNISVAGFLNGKLIDTTEITDADGKIVLEYVGGDYYITVRHNGDLYYTPAEAISSNVNLYVNVTSQTTNNRTVNITAKSNIYNETMEGKLLFILSDNNQILANYSGNGTWWAVHTFDYFAVYEVNASYIGLDDVVITNATINIAEVPTNITLENETVELFAEDSVGTGAALTPAVAGDLTFTSSNESVAKVVDGKIIAVGEGVANITVSFAGSEGYLPALNRTITVTVNRVVTHMVVGNITTYVGLDVNFAVNVTSDDARPFNGTINFTLPDGTVVPVKISNGQGAVPWTVPDNYHGNYSVNAAFAGNTRYLPSKAAAGITVNKYESNVTISEIAAVVYPNNVTVKYSVENRTNVTVTVDGVSADKIVVSNDTVTLIGLDGGKYTIRIANNESNLYYGSVGVQEFTIIRNSSKIAASDITATYNINKDLVITLTDVNGKPLSGAKVTVNLNGAREYTTDGNGQVKVPTRGLIPNTYVAKITFKGNANYNESSLDVKVTVNKAKPKIIAKKKKFKAKSKKKRFKITLKDNTGKPIKKAKVTLKLKKIGKKSKKSKKSTSKKSKKSKKTSRKKKFVKTNSKGKATFKINKSKKGKYQATIKFSGNKYYRAVTKKVRITIK